MTRPYRWTPDGKARHRKTVRKNMKALQADPKFAEFNRERSRKRMKKMWRLARKAAK